MRSNSGPSDVVRHPELKATASQLPRGITGQLSTCYPEPLQCFIINYYYSDTMLPAVHRYWKNFKRDVVRMGLGAKCFTSNRDLLPGFRHNIHSPFVLPVNEAWDLRLVGCCEANFFSCMHKLLRRWKGPSLISQQPCNYSTNGADPLSPRKGTNSLELGEYSSQLEQIQFCSPLISIYNAKFYLIYFFNIYVPQPRLLPPQVLNEVSLAHGPH